jgi:hypothetical protein
MDGIIRHLKVQELVAQLFVDALESRPCAVSLPPLLSGTLVKIRFSFARVRCAPSKQPFSQSDRVYVE